MNLKSTLPSTQNRPIQAETLLSRVGLRNGSTTLDSISVPKDKYWSNRLFTRCLCDAGLSVQQKNAMRLELDKLELGVLERQKPTLSNSTVSGTGQGQVLAPYSKHCTLAVYPDEPIDADSLTAATTIEFQMLGVPFQSLPPNRIACWAPCMPIEIATVDQMAKKINTVRTMVNGRCRIGAAISPASVYEDVRSMADCGVDYVCLLIDVLAELSAGSCMELGAMDVHLEQALKGIRDSGTNVKLSVSVNTTSARQMVGLFQAGVDTLSVDSFLAQSRPAETIDTKDRYGSVLSYGAAQVSPFAWMASAMHKLLQDLSDWQLFSGAKMPLNNHPG